MTRSSELPAWIRGPVMAAAVGAIVWRELRQPLRRRSPEAKSVRGTRNLLIAASAGLVVQCIEAPVARAIARRRWGVLRLLRVPAWIEVTLAVLLLDYTLYLWHVATHKVPLLWRFHAAHHADLAMDASTAYRFHFGEMLFSVLWRAAQFSVIGVPPLAFSIWQTALLVSIGFHHSNWRLKPAFERRLSWLLVTPRMHNIHHSVRELEMNTNWSSGLSWWDRLHGTYGFDECEDKVDLGLAHWRRPADVTTEKVLMLPFIASEESLRQLPG